jgi:hypothetical protein
MVEITREIADFTRERKATASQQRPDEANSLITHFSGSAVIRGVV